MRRIALAFILLGVILSGLCAALNAEFLTLLTEEQRDFLRTRSHFTVLYDPTKAPLEYFDENNSPKGISKGFLDLLIKHTGIDFTVYDAPSWESGYTDFIEGRIDMAIALNPTDERKHHFLFSEPYLSMPIVIIARSEVGYIVSLHQLAGKRLAVVENYSAGEWIKRDHPDLTYIPVSSIAEGLRLVQKGEAFAMLGNLMVVNHYLTSLGMTNTLKVVGTTPYENTFAVAVQPELAPLVPILEVALAQIDEDERATIYAQNLPVRYSLQINTNIVWAAIIVMVFIVTVLVLWVITLSIERRDRRRAEAKMEESVDRFRALFEKAPVPMVLIGSDDTILDVNLRWLSVFGYSRVDFPTRSALFEATHHDLQRRQQAEERWQEMKHGADQQLWVRWETPLTAHSGKTYTMEISATRFSDSMLLSYFDITERNLALREVQHLHTEAEHSRLIILNALEDQQLFEQSLKHSNATLDAAINSMLDAVYIIDEHGCFLLANTAFYEYYRFHTTEQSPRYLSNLAELFFAETEDGTPLTRDELAGYRALNGEVGTMAYRLIRKEDNQWWIGSYSYAPIKDEGDALLGAVVVARDITEERALHQRLRFQRDHDYLTGLYSRVYFEGVVRAMEQQVPLTLGLVDINGLKLVNDTLGTTMGDEMIKRTALLMQQFSRPDMIIARYGGDEFAFLIPAGDERIAEQFVQDVETEAQRIEVATFHLSLSAGWAVRHSLGERATHVLRRAEEMMGRSKLYDSASAKSKTVGLVMNSLFAKSNRESQHSRRVSALCAFIARQLDLSVREVNRMRTAGLMHDIGKIGVSEAILNKPGKLDKAEWEEMRRHPEIGYRILSTVSEFSDLAVAVLEHHERMDGSGYPRGLEGERISYQARIIAIADSYDAMTSERSYRTPISHRDAVEEIWRGRGTLYDPEIVQVFLSTIDEFEYIEEE
jgi:diguanylate cyclase (GGDEF)-like protein/PAS domain S-box-containing protein